MSLVAGQAHMIVDLDATSHRRVTEQGGERITRTDTGERYWIEAAGEQVGRVWRHRVVKWAGSEH